jgi:hypothetical protein
MKRVFLSVFLFILLLQSVVWACVTPISQTVIEAVPMACCAKPCTNKKPQEDVQTVCLTTALQANKTNGFIKTSEISTPHSPLFLASQSFLASYPSNEKLMPSAKYPQAFDALPRYLTFHTLLI